MLKFELLFVARITIFEFRGLVKFTALFFLP